MLAVAGAAPIVVAAAEPDVGALLVGADAARLERGAVLFESNCAACHAGGGNVIGYARGRNLKMKQLVKYGYADAASIGALLREGRGAMPVYAKDRLSDADVEDVSEFVLRAAMRGWK
jgi:cytochrome c6